MEQLLPCPFCNGLPYHEKTICDNSVRCTLCGATITSKNDRNCAIVQPSAAETWNTRSLSNSYLSALDKVEDIMAEFGDDPKQCLEIIGEHIGLTRHSGAPKEGRGVA